jgi:ferredoxin
MDDTSSKAAPAPVRLVVDLNRCEAYAQCCFLAPSVFELHGEEALFYDPEPDEAQRDRVLRAAAACPVQAITVEAPPARGLRR